VISSSEKKTDVALEHGNIPAFDLQGCEKKQPMCFLRKNKTY